MKSIYTLVFSIITFLITTTGFSQDLTDENIGFDADRITIRLKEHGISDPAELNREIEKMRERYKAQYVEIKKSQEELLFLRARKKL
jgi:hypothetical protein